METVGCRSRASGSSRGYDNNHLKRDFPKAWKAAGIDVGLASGSWYLETGSGMGAVLNTAAALNAYTLSDRGTWRKFANRRDLRLLVEGEPRLFNQYGVTLVNPARFPHVRKDEAMSFIEWLTSPDGQQAIADYPGGGTPLFFPNYTGLAS